MMASVPLSKTPTSPSDRTHWTIGRDFLPTSRASHRILADGCVKLRLPVGGVLTDSDAIRLAWGILADLAPDSATPVDVVTYSEAQRLAVLGVIADRPMTARAIAGALEWGIRSAQRRLKQLEADGRVIRHRARVSDPETAYSRALTA